jgi:hypothetical protein
LNIQGKITSCGWISSSQVHEKLALETASTEVRPDFTSPEPRSGCLGSYNVGGTWVATSKDRLTPSFYQEVTSPKDLRKGSALHRLDTNH